jgi:DNA topoisomerase-3
MIAIITDKASIAKQIAQALNMDAKAENGEYIQGRNFILAWISGELVSLSPPDNFGKNRLVKDDLPCIPEEFVLSPRKKQVKKGMIEDKAAVRQLNLIQKVFDTCDSIIVATDAGEIGEMMFRRLYACLGCNKPFRRLWLNSLTAKAIGEELKNPRESALFDHLHAAALCRAKADYLIQFNAGRAFFLSTGLTACPQGWTLMPALAMLCKRFTEHRKFVSSHFFTHHITLEKEGNFLHFTLDGTAKNRRKAEKTYTSLKTFRTAQITKVEIQTAIQPAPALYSLTALQKEAHIRYGFPAAKTMEIVRKLHEEKLVSHPLTGSQMVPGDVVESLPKILRHTAVYCKMADCLCTMEWENLNHRSVGNTAVFRHHALIPTGIYPGYLPKDEKTVYVMIVNRTLEAFAPDCRKEVTRVKAAAGSLVFKSEKSRILSPGWRSIRNREEDREEGEVKGDDLCPVFANGETVRISGWNLLMHKTLPLPLYTEASLLTAMEEAGLGVPDTRTSVIEALFENGYIKRRGKSLLPSEKGIVVYHCLKNMRITNAEMSGGWERMLADVACGRQDAETFMRAFDIFTRQVTEEILTLNPPRQRRKR